MGNNQSIRAGLKALYCKEARNKAITSIIMRIGTVLYAALFPLIAYTLYTFSGYCSFLMKGKYFFLYSSYFILSKTDISPIRDTFA